MKKILALMLCLCLMVVMCVGCSNSSKEVENSKDPVSTQDGEKVSDKKVEKKYKIGYANLDDSIAFCQLVKESIQENCDILDIELVTADNKLDGPTALANAESFILQEVDGVIEFQSDAKFAEVIMDKFNENNIPVVAVDIPHPGATFFGVNNYHVGRLAGEALAQWVNSNWDGAADTLISLELPQSGELVMQRSNGMYDGFMENVKNPVPDDMIFREDSHHTQEESKRVVDDLLPKIDKDAKIVVLCVQDMAALGAIAALETAGRQGNASVVAQNCGPEAVNELVRPGTCMFGSTGYFPEHYGDKMIPTMLNLIEGKDVPEEVFVDNTFVTIDNLFDFYPEAKEKYDELRK